MSAAASAAAASAAAAWSGEQDVFLAEIFARCEDLDRGVLRYVTKHVAITLGTVFATCLIVVATRSQHA